MSKIGLIIGREFNQRVRKRTFILTTVLTPLLMVVLMVAPVLLNKVGFIHFRLSNRMTWTISWKTNILLPNEDASPNNVSS